MIRHSAAMEIPVGYRYQQEEKKIYSGLLNKIFYSVADRFISSITAGIF
ncbi:MAG: hypothetical protein GY854_04815 [Deltaproteobacteria bacterium]|nr:hypothetical protein [Deltaproteobacteria bacterium]